MRINFESDSESAVEALRDQSKEVAKWKKRTSVADLPTGPKDPRSTVLSAEEEAIIVAFRKHTLLPLDDCLYALQPTIPHLSRSSLHRCLHRHGISRLPDVEGDKPARRKFKAYPIGYFHIDIAEVQTAEGKLYLFVAIDRTSKFAFAELHTKAGKMNAAQFLRNLIAAVPYTIHTILTDNGYLYALNRRRGFYPTRKLFTLARSIAAKDSYLQRIRVEHRDGRLDVTIDRPQTRNALSIATLSELAGVFSDTAHAGDVKVAVLSGTGDKAFAAGGDLKELAGRRSAEDASALFEIGARATEAIRRFPVPVVAALNGVALGGGAELAVACDFRLAATHAAIGFVQARLGLSTGFGGRPACSGSSVPGGRCV